VLAKSVAEISFTDDFSFDTPNEGKQRATQKQMFSYTSCPSIRRRDGRERTLPHHIAKRTKEKKSLWKRRAVRRGLSIVPAIATGVEGHFQLMLAAWSSGPVERHRHMIWMEVVPGRSWEALVADPWVRAVSSRSHVCLRQACGCFGQPTGLSGFAVDDGVRLAVKLAIRDER
jgi:hypothetical protein